jgi:hypothetical protein
MLTRFSKVGAVVICLLLVAVTLASAADTYPSSQNAARDGSGGWQAAIISVAAQGSGGTCSLPLTSIAFYQWNLSVIPDGSTIASVSVALPVVTSSRPVAADITLYGTTDDTWGAAAVVGNALSTVNWAAGNGATTLTFPTSQALVDYVKTALTDNTANFAIGWSTCPGDSTNTFNARFQTNATSPGQMTVDITTAVTMSTFHTTDPAVNWPVILGLGALAAVVIGGLAVSRRRAAAR